MSISNSEPPVDVQEYVAKETVLSSDHICRHRPIIAAEETTPLQVNNGATDPLNIDCESISITTVSDIKSLMSTITNCEKKGKGTRKVKTVVQF